MLLGVAPKQPAFGGYRLSTSFVDKGPFRDGAPLRRGAIVNGLRVRPDATGLAIAESVTVPPLQAGVSLPDWLGGGLLFWNDSALYTADSFLGPLTPLLDVGFRPVRVSFGPSFALLRGSDGQRLAIDFRTRQRVPVSPQLLVDIASTPDGRALALLESGACQFSDDSGKSYGPVPLPVGTQATSVQESSGTLVANLSSGARVRLDSGGKSQLEGAPRARAARSTDDALWPLSESPLERALAYGVPIGQEFAGVAAAGGVATVNLRTGELVQMTRALMPSDLSCRTLESKGTFLLACSSHAGSVLFSDVFGERPVTQAKFPAGVMLEFAEGVLVAAARCDGQVHPGAVCVRDADGRFHDFDVSAQLALLEQAAPQPKPGGKPVLIAPSISRWIPKLGGGAVALVSGSAPGLLDAQSGKFVPLSEQAMHAGGDARRSPDQWLGLDWIAFKDGSVRGWAKDAGVAIGSDGRLEPSVYEFSALGGAGASALAFDRGRRVFQSLDWGRTWVETLAPPGSATTGKAALAPRCSRVGCVLGPWLRVGWEPEVPAAFARPQVTSAPPSSLRPQLPQLICKQLAAPVVLERAQSPGATSAGSNSGLGVGPASVARADEYQGFFAWSTAHPIHGSGAPLGLRASFGARRSEPQPADEPPAKSWPGYSWSKRFSFVPAFDPSAPVQLASITWRALFDAASASGAEPPSLTGDEAELFGSVPVLGRNAGEAGGLVLDDGAPVWLHGPGSIEALSLAAPSSEGQLISAVARAPHTIDVLSAGTDGSLEVIEILAGKARRLFQRGGEGAALYPANPDALAIGAQDKLAILRAPSGSDPATLADPAVLLHEDGTLSVLAPWSKLFLADAPECRVAPNDFRAVLQTSRAWLRLIDSGASVSDEALAAGMFAAVRVNSERWCLEAVELSAGPDERNDSSNETRLSARFTGPRRAAARLGFGAGFEFRQPLGCSLSGSP